MDRYRELIKENIDFDLLLTEYPYDEDTLEGYVELMVESKRAYTNPPPPPRPPPPGPAQGPRRTPYPNS